MPTLVVKRLIKPGYEREYEQSLAKLIDQAEELDGYMGVNIARPQNKKNPLYVFSAKFDTKEHLQKYINSPFRKALIHEWHDKSQGPIAEKTLSGVDWWFVLPGGHSDIPKYKMVFLTIAAAYPIVMFFTVILTGFENIAYTALRTLFTITMTVILMTYFTLPFLINYFKKWLQEDSKS